jgi:hypothetical protein
MSSIRYGDIPTSLPGGKQWVKLWSAAKGGERRLRLTDNLGSKVICCSQGSKIGNVIGCYRHCREAGKSVGASQKGSCCNRKSIVDRGWSS